MLLLAQSISEVACRAKQSPLVSSQSQGVVARTDPLNAAKRMNTELHSLNEHLRLKEEIEILEGYIELARSRDDEPRVEDLQKQLAAKTEELDALKTTFQSVSRIARRWWQFWR